MTTEYRRDRMFNLILSGAIPPGLARDALAICEPVPPRWRVFARRRFWQSFNRMAAWSGFEWKP